MTTWSGVAEAYRVSFATLCAGTIDRLLDDTAGPRHLDVGSGTGELARRAQARGRTVVAVDADPEMVALSSQQHAGTTVQAALPHLPLHCRFDAVTANFVINHTPDPRAAVRELARLVRPGGRVAITIWPSDPPAWASLVQEAFEAAGVVSPPSRRLEPGLDFERSVAGLTSLATSARLAPLGARELRWEWRTTVDDFWSGLAGGVATAGQVLAAQTADVRRAAERAFRDLTSALVGPDQVLALPSRAAYLLATPAPNSLTGPTRPTAGDRTGGGRRARRSPRR
ncbi:class I SAM-dependent methyltransferase [Nocardioides litoris]|uniref:class I SAM-dependent methyltransferase n=1 Tax=Nocardioides litoris TaxID=1926648 RepID=UPI00111E06D3|nr:class I SAM-dependent methyltransferase [Nocardioides litoris]